MTAAGERLRRRDVWKLICRVRGAVAARLAPRPILAATSGRRWN